MKLLARPRRLRSDQSGINMVDLMMWLVIAALLLAAAIQAIGYYQQAAYAYQAKNDVTHGHEWAAANTSLTSKLPTTDDLQAALDANDFRISNDNDIALFASQGHKYCLGIKAGNVLGDSVFYSTSDEPSKIIRATSMPSSCGDLIQARGPNAPSLDFDGDGISDEYDTDIDGDGILNNNDPDVDGDGILNADDTDVDGDGTANADDESPNGAMDTITFANAAGGSVDQRVSVSDVNYLSDGTNIQVRLALNLVGASGLTSTYYGLSVQITCLLPDSTKYHKYTSMWTSYTSKSNPTPAFNFACPAGSPVGYVVGTTGGAPELTASIGYPGPTNVGRGGSQLLTGNTQGIPSFGSSINPRVALRSVSTTSDNASIILGQVLNLGGTSNTDTYYGLSWRMTCQLPDGSQFHKYGSMYTSYKSATYPAPNYTTAVCGGSATVVGYVAGTYGGDPALTSNSGYAGPTNTIESGIRDLQNDPGIAPTGGWYSQRITGRKVTYNGATATIGMNLDLGGAASTSVYWGLSYRLTCQTADGTKSYVTGSLSTSYNSSSFPAPNFNSKSCPAGTTVTGHVLGTYNGHPALTSNPSQAGPKNVLVGGVQ